MKNVLILTIPGLWNYGNRLQNYAVDYMLKHKFKLHTYNYINKKNYSYIRMYISSVLRKNLSSLRYLLFLNFNKLYSNDVLVTKNPSHFSNIDFVICGSDQILHPKWGMPYIHNISSVPYIKHIAYSSSFGVSKIQSEYVNEYQTYLNSIKSISVREDSGADIVKELTGKDVPVLIDPTMMLTKEEWLKVAKKPKFYKKGEKFILTYFLGDVLQEYRKYIENFAKENNCEIINLELHNTNKYWHYTGPSEFVWLINNCTAMFTDSFHGSVFSILMDTPFIVFDRDGNGAGMGSRIDTLLDKFKLNDRKYSNQTTQQVLNIDYSHIEPILNIERKKSIDFLKDAMEM